MCEKKGTSHCVLRATVERMLAEYGVAFDDDLKELVLQVVLSSRTHRQLRKKGADGNECTDASYARLATI